MQPQIMKIGFTRPATLTTEGLEIVKQCVARMRAHGRITSAAPLDDSTIENILMNVKRREKKQAQR